MQKAQENPLDQPPADSPCAVLSADLAFLLCLEAWSFPDLDCSNNSPQRWLDSQWQQRLDLARNTLGAHPPTEALDLLRRSHHFQCRADTARVHSTWWARALQDESPAVRRSIARQKVAQLCAASSEGSDIVREADGNHDPDPAAARWVISLIAERLVGGEPVRSDEPPAIVALAALSSRQLYRLSHAAGQAKTVLAGEPHGFVDGRSLDDQRTRWLIDRFSSQFGTSASQAQAWANRDLQASRKSESLGRRRGLASLGLNTIARLLAGCEPYRVRWALQHIPYPVAKRIRSIMSSSASTSHAIQRLESEVLRTAWTRLTLENRVSVEHPEESMGPDHAC